MKKRNKIIIIICISVLLVLFLTIGIWHWIDSYKNKHELDDLDEKNLLSLSIESNNSENHNERMEMYIDFEKRTINSEIKTENNAKEEKEVVLTEEQCEELKEYIADYSHKVKEKENEYWPQTDEYPAMYTLFRFKLEFEDSEGSGKYSESGALCYPDGWDEFIDKLMEY